MELISREEAKRKIIEELDSIDHVPNWVFRRLERVISSLPTVEERKEGEWEWCHDCKEYDQERHCCHRWSNAIRKTVAELEEHYGKYINKHDKTLVIDYPNTDDVEVIRLMDDEGFTRVFVER